MGLPAGPVLQPHEALEDPHVIARDTIKTIQTPEGIEQRIPGPSAKFSRTPIDIRATAPALGENNREILNELGISVEKQKGLEEKGIL